MDTLDQDILVGHIDDSPLLIRLEVAFIGDDFLINICRFIDDVKYFVIISSCPDDVLIFSHVLNMEHLIFALYVLFHDQMSIFGVSLSSGYSDGFAIHGTNDSAPWVTHYIYN